MPLEYPSGFFTHLGHQDPEGHSVYKIAQESLSVVHIILYRIYGLHPGEKFKLKFLKNLNSI